GADLALLPLTSAFDTDANVDGEDYYQENRLQRRYSHMHAWGTTAQGVYRAGDTIQFKFYVRDQDNRTFVPPPRDGYSLQILDPMDNLAFEIKELSLSEFGAAAGEFTVAAGAPVGWYRFVLKANFREGEWEPMRVLVSDFTPAPFRTTTDLNGELFRDGETVKVSSRARLHSGGPYADAGTRITARLQQTAFVSTHPLARTFWFDTLLPGYWEQRDIYSSEGAVNAQGDQESEFTLSKAGILYGQLTVESAVRDDRGKYVASEATARYVGRDRFVGLRQSEWVLQKGKTATIETLVVDEFGTPAKGTEVKLTVEYRQTLASRVKGSGNAYITRFEHQWLAVDETTREPGSEPAAFAFTPEKPGYYRITAVIEDRDGRPQSTVMYRWAAGAGEVIWENGADNALSIIPEKSEAKIGEKARFLVQNPYPGAKALVTVERYGVLKSWVTTFPDSTAMVEVEVEPDYLPGFYLCVTLFSPRVDKPMGDGEVDLGKPAFRIGCVAMPVRDPYKELVVTAKPDREVYRPRDQVTVDLKVQPRQAGAKLPPTELAVVVLDEAVFDLIQGGKNYYDVYKGFYTLDGLDLRTYNLLMQLVGRQKFEKKGASPGGDGGPDLAMRSLFKFVAYWNPTLRTNAKGEARITFKLPDNLTGWRVLALAVTPGDRMGLGDVGFKVNQPTELRPALPNQLLDGDSVKAGFTVMNRTDHERTLTVKLAARGPLAAPAEVTTSVVAPPYKRVNVWLPLRTQGAGELTLTARASDSVDGDLTEVKIPVRRRITLETAATYGTTTAAAIEERIAFPAGIRSDVGGVSVVAAPTVIGNVAGAFAYLRDYPYICWEQKLTKGVMASHYRQLRAYLPPDLIWPEAAALPQQTLKLARDYQAPNGGMAYYRAGNEYVSPYLSAYTALAFNWLRAAGEEIPLEVEKSLHGYLLELLRRDEFPSFYSKGMGSTVRAVALAALAPHNKLSKADLERYRPHLHEMSLFGKAHYLQALLAVKGTESLRDEVAKLILAHANETGGKFIFGEELDAIYQQIHTSTLRDNAAILSALLLYAETPAGGKLIADVPFKLVRAITQSRGGRDRWENTQENIFCLNALIDYRRLYEQEKPAMTVRAQLDGVPFGSASFKAFTDPAVTLERPTTAADPGRTATVRLEKEGGGRLYYAARLTFAPLQLPTTSANAGIEVQREYSVERKGKWELLKSPMTIKSGELVRVDLYLSLPAARHFVVVDDPVPGGLEPVNRDLATASKVDDDKAEKRYAGSSWWFRFNDWREYGYSRWSFYHRELRHHAVRYYSEYLSAGNYHLSYVAQAIAPGEFTVPPLVAEEMYDPDVFGRSPAAVLKVEGGE
ncbi:MAG: large extracellular alpha-helical protein, partial [Desulfuromonadales bacterium GWD2_61_12]